MGKKWLAALALLFATSAAQAGGYRAEQDIEASMLVTGTIEVNEQGRVERFEVDRREALPDHVTRLLARAIPQWEFEPTLQDGQPASVRTSMRVRVAANELADESIVLRIAGASFGDPHQEASRRNAPPHYPREALKKGVSATVYLLCRVGRDGAMQEVIAEQVNLRYLGPERVMAGLRETFADASIRAAMKWTYALPEDVAAASDPYWSVRVPVTFTLDIAPTPGYGEWESYVAGPTQTAWWVEEEARGQRADTFAAGGFYLVGQDGLKLLTPLEGNG